MNDQPVHAQRSPGLALLAWLVLSWCFSAYGDSPGETGNQRGRFDITRTVTQLIDQPTMESLSETLDPDDEITWQVYVPDSYDPSEPAGLLVYVSPTPYGRMPSGWQPLFDDENLIWISADRSGNRTRTKSRMLYAALAPYVLSDTYEIDPTRIYVSGFSGGGKVAGLVSLRFANLFTGAIYICGAEYIPIESEALHAAAISNRYVFFTGGKDFNRSLTRSVYRKYERAGLTNINLISISGMGHETPGRERFRQAVNFLDQRE